MEPTKETAPAPTKRELLAANLKHLRENTSNPSCEQTCVLLMGEAVLEMTEKQPALLPVS